MERREILQEGDGPPREWRIIGFHIRIMAVRSPECDPEVACYHLLLCPPFSRACPSVLHQGESGPDMSGRRDSNTPGGDSGRGLVQQEETPGVQGQSCAKTTPTPPKDPEVTWLSRWVPPLQSQARSWPRDRPWGDDVKTVNECNRRTEATRKRGGYGVTSSKSC